jgi:hypothetical protein
MLLLGLAFELAGVGLCEAKSVRKPKVNPIEAQFDAKLPDVRDCALFNGINLGASAVDLQAKVLIGSDGRVIGAEVTATTDGGNKQGIETCVSAVLQKMTFPTATTSLRQLLRNWRFAIR